MFSWAFSRPRLLYLHGLRSNGLAIGRSSRRVVFQGVGADNTPLGVDRHRPSQRPGLEPGESLCAGRLRRIEEELAARIVETSRRVFCPAVPRRKPSPSNIGHRSCHQLPRLGDPLVGVKSERSEYDRLSDAAFLRRQAVLVKDRGSGTVQRKHSESGMLCHHCGYRDSQAIRLAAIAFVVSTVFATVSLIFVPNTILRDLIAWGAGVVSLFSLLGLWVMAFGLIAAATTEHCHCAHYPAEGGE